MCVCVCVYHIIGIELTPTYDAGFCNFFYTATFACHWDKRSERVAKLRKVFFCCYQTFIYLERYY